MAKFRLRPVYIVPLLVVALIAVLWWVNHQEQVPGYVPGQHHGMGGRHGGFGGMMGPLPVIAERSQVGDIQLFLNGLGTVTPLTTDTVRTQISGYLTQIHFQEGQTVRKGDVLAVIDPRPYQVALETAEGQLMQAQANLKEAQLDLERYKQLAKQDSIAQQQVDTQAALVIADQGVVKVDQAAIDSAKLNLTYCHITAPVSGVVGLRQVDIGNYVTPGDTNGIVVLTQLQPISVIFTLPEDDIPAVERQLHSGAKLAVDAYDRTLTTKLASGAIVSIDNEVDPTTGTFKLRALFPNTDHSLFPSQFVNARMLLQTLHDVTYIPTSSIERSETGTFVYVVQQPDNTVTAKPIQLGVTEGEKVQVLSGLGSGDLVVVDGADKLKEGSEVIVQTPQQALPSTGVPADRAQGRWKGMKGGKGKGQWKRKRSAPSSES